MNLYIINKVLFDYTAGMAVIAAPSLDRCREIFVEEFSDYIGEFDTAIEKGYYKVIEGVDYVVDLPEGVVSHVLGGG